MAGDDTLEAFPKGPLALNFANTIASHVGDAAYDWMSSYEALVNWCRRAGAITTPFARKLLDEARNNHRREIAAMTSARALRRAIYDVMSARARGHAPLRAALATLNTHLQRANAHVTLRCTDVECTREWHDDPANLESVLWPIARSAADVLTSADAGRIVECEGAECTWLFVDATKNRSKRFCRSTGCGNRARVRRFYARRQI